MKKLLVGVGVYDSIQIPIQVFLDLLFFVDAQLVGGYANSNADIEPCQPRCEISGLLIAAVRL